MRKTRLPGKYPPCGRTGLGLFRVYRALGVRGFGSGAVG